MVRAPRGNYSEERRRLLQSRNSTPGGSSRAHDSLFLVRPTATSGAQSIGVLRDAERERAEIDGDARHLLRRRALELIDLGLEGGDETVDARRLSPAEERSPLAPQSGDLAGEPLDTAALSRPFVAGAGDGDDLDALLDAVRRAVFDLQLEDELSRAPPSRGGALP